MALDFAQVDEAGRVTGKTVRIGPDDHHRLIQRVPGRDYPMLARLADYYTDVSFRSDELALLGAELQGYKRTLVDARDISLIEDMTALVLDSIKAGLLIEAIAD